MTVQSHGFSSYLLIYFSAQNFILNIFFSVSPHIFFYESVFMHWNCRDRMYGSWVWPDCKFKISATTCILLLPSVLQADTQRHEQSVNISTKGSCKKTDILQSGWGSAPSALTISKCENFDPLKRA